MSIPPGTSTSAYDGRRVLVAGAGISGAAAARALRDRGALVTVVDGDPDRAATLRGQGLPVTDTQVAPAGTDLVVTSPGWRPDSPLLVGAARAGIEVIGEVELAWRLRGPAAAPWLAVTGTNGKTTTVRMLEAVLRAAGHRAVAAGNVGLPLLAAVLDPEPYDVLAVELSSFQLHWSSSVRPAAAAVLNLADDHTDWHGSRAGYVQAKRRIWAGGVAIGGLDDPATGALLSSAPGRRVGFTLRVPRSGELGLVQDLLVDRAFPDVAGEATELAGLADLAALPGPHNVANALAAAALARAHGVPAAAVRDGLRGVRPDPHRNEQVATSAVGGSAVGGSAGGSTAGDAAGSGVVTWMDDSKATNPHAAAASLSSYASVVWIAGGLLKGADVDVLVADAAPRLAAAVLLGTDRAALREALRRHAPDLPVVEVERRDAGAMSEAVAAAARLAAAGDTVLLAPAAASMDCFRDYAERGELFARAARAVAGPGAQDRDR